MFKQINATTGHSRFCFYLIVVLSLFAMVVECAALWAWDQGLLSVGYGALLHIGVSSAFALLAYARLKMGKSAQLLGLAFPVVLALGPVGASGIFFTSVLHARYHRKATPFEDWYREIVPDHITSSEEHLIERLKNWDGEEGSQQVPMPFADVFAAGQRAEKISAITLMLRNYSPSFAPAFREALNDPDNAVRVQAASAITRLEENFLADNLLLEQQRSAQPNDIKSLEKLARHYDEHATAALCDEGSIIEFRNKAEQAYRKLHELKQEDTDILWSLGRLLIRASQLEEAAETFEKVLKVSNGVADPLKRVWYWECLYSQERYAELREQIQNHYHEIPKDSVLPQDLLESIRLWNDTDSLQEQVAA